MLEKERSAWRSEFEGQRILIWGYGREGRATAELIHAVCPDLSFTITDRQPQAVAEAKTLHPYAIVRLQEEIDFGVYTMILKAPGIVLPKDFSHAGLTSETQLFLKHYGQRTIGITGTKGKSTTAALTAAMLGEGGPVHLVGNIGVPCFAVIDALGERDRIVFEMSCHQLEFSTFSPHVAVFLNLYEEHLDHYGTFAAYGNAKANIYRHQHPGDILFADPQIASVGEERSDFIRIGSDVYAKGRCLHIPGHVLTVADCALIGSHNAQNAAVAYAIAHHCGISDAQVLHALSLFKPLPHRLEKIGVFQGVCYVNDSISTIGQSAIRALEALPETDCILIGGMDRGIAYDELEDYLGGHRHLQVILMYAAGERIYTEMKQKGLLRPTILLTDTLEQAVMEGKKRTRKGHICLLSPAAASYDHFKNFEERGEVFRRLVEQE